MSKGPPTGPRAPKLRVPEVALVPLRALGAPFAPLWVPLGRLPSASVALPPSERVSSAPLGRLWASPGPSQRPKCTISLNKNNDFAMSPLRTKVSPSAAFGALLGPFCAPWPPPGGPRGPLGDPQGALKARHTLSKCDFGASFLLSLHFQK